jgi:hypothetical protein
LTALRARLVNTRRRSLMPLVGVDTLDSVGVGWIVPPGIGCEIALCAVGSRDSGKNRLLTQGQHSPTDRSGPQKTTRWNDAADDMD